jgi:2-hydroxychromene-2-carboxylate isomerase
MRESATALDFWFDYHSPWAFLAATQIEALVRRHGLSVRWRPLHLPRLIAAIGGRRSLEESAAFVRWYRQDLRDWAALCGLAIRYHPDYPLRPARALRATLFAETQGRAPDFALAVFRAYWIDSEDISDLDTLARLARLVGLNGADVKVAAEDPLWKARLESNNEEAAGRGVFGVPTIDTGDKLYFGNDRLALLDHHLGGPGPQVFNCPPTSGRQL